MNAIEGVAKLQGIRGAIDILMELVGTIHGETKEISRETVGVLQDTIKDLKAEAGMYELALKKMELEIKE